MVLLTHPRGDTPQCLQFMALVFVSRWCQLVFLHSLSGDGHLLLVQNVLGENVTLLSRAEADCTFATAAPVFNVPSFQITYIPTSQVSAGTGDPASDLFPGFLFSGIYP